MTYTKSQLESLIRGLEKALNLFDVAWFVQVVTKPQWATDYRTSLVEDLTTYRKALAEVSEEPAPLTYAQGLADGRTIGYAEGFDEGYDVCANDHDLELSTGRTMRGSEAYWSALRRSRS